MSRSTDLGSAAILVLALAGCASQTGVVQIGEGKYTVMRRETGPMASLSGAKGKAYQAAGEFCTARGKQLNVIESRDVPRSLGQMPEAEVQFTCI